MRQHCRPTWAEIDLNAIRHNFLQIKKLLHKQTKVLAAVKANAYGHGILEVSDMLVSSGVDYLGVGTTDEALYLRRNGFKIPVLILGTVLSDEVEAIIRNNITQTVGDLRLARYINRYCARTGKRGKVHIKIDTGMGRIGIWHKQAIQLIRQVARLESLEIEGIFSHFPSADEDEVLTRSQIADFSSVIEELEELDIKIRYRHMANSIAIVDYQDSHMNLVRPGLMIYGLNPKSGVFHEKIDLRPALSLRSRIVFIKNVPPGRKISYGGTYTTTRHTRIATIPIGYGDGFSRRLSNKGHVLIKGKKAPILGRVCMDQIMVDIGNIRSAKLGDEVVLIGRQGKNKITVEEIAGLCDTIPYEVACWFDNRVSRHYKKS
jgi:alanine racemase